MPGLRSILRRALSGDVDSPIASPPPVADVASAAEDGTRAGVVARPDDQAALDRWVTQLQGAGLAEEAICEALAVLQEEHDEPLATVLLYLLTADTWDEVWRERLATWLSRFVAGDPHLACRQVWGAYASLLPLDEATCVRVKSMRAPVIQLSFLLAEPRFHRVRVDGEPWAKEGSLSLTAKVDWSEVLPDVDREQYLAFVDTILAPPVLAGGMGSGAPDDPRAFASDTARRVVDQFERFIGFQDRAVQAGTLAFVDPLAAGGDPLEPFDGLMAFDRSVYSFAGEELFLFIAGGAGSRAVGVYLAGRNVLIDFESGLHRVVSDRLMANLFSQLLLRVARTPEPYLRAVEQVRARAESASALEPRSVVIGMGRAQNFAHHLWNYYPGLERLVDSGLARRVTEVHSAGSEFFGPVQEIFPELGAARMVRNDRKALWDPYPFSVDHLILQPGGYFIPAVLIDRIVQTMAKLPIRDPSAHQPDLAGERPFPIVWIGMRLGSRSWWEQETQIPELTRRVLERYPHALFLLDGFSFPVGHDDISTKWSASIDGLRELANSIIATTSQPDRVLSLVGNTLRESVLWAREVDTYLAPIGTSQHKVGWFTPAPGATYGPESMAKLGPPARRFGAWEAEGTTVPAYVFGETIELGERRGLTDRRDFLDNVRLDLDSLVETMCELIERRREQRSDGA